MGRSTIGDAILPEHVRSSAVKAAGVLRAHQQTHGLENTGAICKTNPEFDYSVDREAQTGGREKSSSSSSSHYHQRQQQRKGTGLAGGNGSSKRMGAKAKTVTFVVHALISFVGMVVIPARLTWEMLIVRHSTGSSRNGSNDPVIFEEAAAAAAAAEGSREALSALHTTLSGAVAWKYVTHDGGDAPVEEDDAWVLVSERSHAVGIGGDHFGSSRGEGRRRMQAEEEGGAVEGESFTYNAITQFYLCSNVADIPAEAMQAAVLEIFGVDESQVGCFLLLLLLLLKTSQQFIFTDRGIYVHNLVFTL